MDIDIHNHTDTKSHIIHNHKQKHPETHTGIYNLIHRYKMHNHTDTQTYMTTHMDTHTQIHTHTLLVFPHLMITKLQQSGEGW